MKKRYVVNWDDDEVASVEIDGRRYTRIEEIPDETDRRRVMLLTSDQAELVEQRLDPMTRNIFRLLFGVGIFLLLLAAVIGFFTGRAIAREVVAPGNVVDFAIRQDSSGSEFYYPVVEYLLPDGSFQRAQLSEGSWPPAYASGEAVTVRYNPENPLDAHIQSTSSTLGRWTWSLILGFMGVMFLGVTGFVRWMFGKDKGSPQSTQSTQRNHL